MNLFAGKYDTEIKTQRRKLTVFFSDIKNFTSTSENLQPEDLTKYLNEYFSEMTKIALNHGATIDKYIGDAMMVFLGILTLKVKGKILVKVCRDGLKDARADGGVEREVVK